MRLTFSFFSTPVFRIWLAITLVASGVMCFIGMTASLGFEYAFVSGVYLSLAAGHLAAVHPTRIRNQLAPFPGVSFSALKLFGHAGLPALVLAIVVLSISLLNMIRVPPCNTGMGLQFFLLIPVISSVLSATCGLALGLFFRTKISAVIAWYVTWFSAVLWLGSELFTTPAVYAYSPFVGFWPGVLYDKAISIEIPLLTYRLVNLITVVTLLGLIHASLDAATMRLQIVRLMRAKKNGAIPAIGILILILTWSAAPSLHHRTTTETLQQALPFKRVVANMELFFDQRISPRQRHLIVRDAEFSLTQVKKYFDVSSTAPLQVFVFYNADQKKYWMGAHHTSVAKPWLGQTYVVADEIPHWTLRHELAHLISAEFGRGPFRIAGYWGGWIPNPGLLEGIATAATPVQGEMSLHQRTKALLQLNLLPSLDQLFSVSFLGVYSGSAYTTAGSFCRFFKDTFGADALKELYAGRSIKKITGATPEAVELQWKSFLKDVPLTREQEEQIAYMYNKPAIVSTRCVREVTRLENAASQYAQFGHWSQALFETRLAHQISGNSTQTQMSLLRATANCGRTEEVIRVGQQMLTDKTETMVAQHIQEMLIDADIDHASPNELAQRYRLLFQKSVGAAERRRIYIKSQLTERYPKRSNYLLKYLSTMHFQNSPSDMAMLNELILIANETGDPLVHYLIGRMLAQHQAPQQAAVELKKVASRLDSLPLEIQLEVRITLGELYTLLGQYHKAAMQFKLVPQMIPNQLGTSEFIQDWLERLRWLSTTKKH